MGTAVKATASHVPYLIFMLGLSVIALAILGAGPVWP
jgi:hypothetical protein